MIREVLTEAHLKGMSYEGTQQTNLVLHYVGIIFLVPMTCDHITGSITDGDIVDGFSVLAGEDGNPMDWICTIIKANNDPTEVSTICTNISRSESTYIHISCNSA